MRQLILGIAIASLVACSTDDPDLVVGELASDRIELSAEVAERILSIEVREGEAVSAGQVLVRQDPERLEAQLAERVAAVNQQRARLAELQRGPRLERLDQARAALAGAESELELRRAELERIVQLRERGLSSEDDLDRAAAGLDAAQSNVASTRSQVEELVSGTTVEELRQAESVLAQAEARMAAARIEVERLVIRAPLDGVADTRLFEPGEIPSPGQPLFVMLSGEQAHARVFVPEALRAAVMPGTEADVYVDGIAEPLAGRVRWVASEPMFTPYYALTERDRGRLSFMAKVDLIDTDKRLPDGVPVNVVFD